MGPRGDLASHIVPPPTRQAGQALGGTSPSHPIPGSQQKQAQGKGQGRASSGS